jgi:sodium-dependent phosphate cotransporter
LYEVIGLSRRGASSVWDGVPILSNKKVRLLLVLGFGIFLFISSLEGVKSGFKLIFDEWQKGILGMITDNTAPVTGLAIGILSTALVQSSSAVVAATMVSMSGMVTSGLPMVDAMRFGVPMVLGANIGTTVTNTIVIFGVRRGMTMSEFGDTIPGVIVDDVYEFLTISLFFILEMTTGFISNTTLKIGEFLSSSVGLEETLASFDKTIIDIIIKEPIVKPLKNLVVEFTGTKVGGVALFIFWFLVIIFSMGLITKGLENLIQTDWEDKIKAAFNSPARSFFTGFSITWLVGSSSIGTSLMVPFLATKVVDLKKAYPYLCGCNMGTTVDLSQIYGYIAGGMVGVMLGSAHVMLNIIAMLLWLVSPLRFVPVRVSEWIGKAIQANENAAMILVTWVVVLFFVLPIVVIYIA